MAQLADFALNRMLVQESKTGHGGMMRMRMMRMIIAIVMTIGFLQSNQLCEASFSNLGRATARAIELKVDAHVTGLLSKIHLRGLGMGPAQCQVETLKSHRSECNPRVAIKGQRCLFSSFFHHHGNVSS